MTMEYPVQFCISLFDLGVFWHYLRTFRKRKNIREPACAGLLLLLAAVWAWTDVGGKPYLNLLVLVAVLSLVTLFFEGNVGAKAVSVITFVGTGIIAEPVGMLLLYGTGYVPGRDSIYIYYFVAAVCAFVRGNVIFLICRFMARKELDLLKLPKEIVGVIVLVFALSVMNCCFITILFVETDSEKNKFMCISIICVIILSYYFMLYITGRLDFLARKQHEDELYMEEMHYKEVYYAEAEKRGEYVQNLKHDLKNKLFALHHLIAEGDTGALMEQIGELCSGLEQIDADSYSANPPVDTVLRVKLGMAKSEGIKVDAQVHIPKQLGMEHGDVGVLYGNLLDNAVEACRKIPEDERFIRVASRYLSGNLLLVVTNSKEGKKNGRLVTTKKDDCGHGRGITSVRRVVEKYNGIVRFMDNGTTFEASVMLYGIDPGKEDSG